MYKTKLVYLRFGNFFLSNYSRGEVPGCLTLMPGCGVVWTGVHSMGVGPPWSCWTPEATGEWGWTSRVNDLLSMAKAAVGSERQKGGLLKMSPTVTMVMITVVKWSLEDVSGDRLTVLCVLLDSRVVFSFGETSSWEIRLLLRHQDTDQLWRGAALTKGWVLWLGNRSLDLELDLGKTLGNRWLLDLHLVWAK